MSRYERMIQGGWQSNRKNTTLEGYTRWVNHHLTRWDELKDVIEIAINIGTIYSNIDVAFLNRPSVLNVSDFSQLKKSLNPTPEGRTPLSHSFSEVQTSAKTDKVLIVIATDGVPNNLHNFKKLIETKNHDKFYISFLACSDDDNDIGYLNDLDIKVPRVDVLDDYASEKKEVLKAQGYNFSYTYADHIVRLLLGPICPELDSLDEKEHFCNFCKLL